MIEQHLYNLWKQNNLNHLENIYSIFYYYFKELYFLSKDSKEEFFKLIYERY